MNEMRRLILNLKERFMENENKNNFEFKRVHNVTHNNKSSQWYLNHEKDYKWSLNFKDQNQNTFYHSTRLHSFPYQHPIDLSLRCFISITTSFPCFISVNNYTVTPFTSINTIVESRSLSRHSWCRSWTFLLLFTSFHT